MFEPLEDRRLLASLLVVTGGDLGDGTCSAARCTLRDAIEVANANPGADQIQFASSVTGTISLESSAGAIVIRDPVSITGPGASLLAINADTATREFRVIDVTLSGGDVAIEGLTVSGGKVLSEAGGGIRFGSSGTLTIRSSTISGNVAANGAGAYSENDGNIEVIDSTISGNTAMYGAGGGIQNVDGEITVTSSVIDNNAAFNSGGGISSRLGGNITLTDSQVTNNRVTYAGYQGGGINSGDGNLTISGSTITGNVSAGDGGGVYNYSGIVTISQSVISGNDAAYSGGAILNETGIVSLTDSTIDSNRALYGDGGGIATDSGNLTLTRTSVSGNRSEIDGGGISTGSGSAALVNSTVSGNTSLGSGGGIASRTGLVSLLNVTVSGNSATGDGGGVHASGGPVQIVSSTLTVNHADNVGGGVGLTANDDGVSLSLVNSIIAANSVASSPEFIAPANTTNNLQVTFSLVGDLAGTSLNESTLTGGVAQPDANGNLVGGGASPIIDPLLGPLSDNGGSTQTHPLLAGSLAIDAGSGLILPADSFDIDGDGNTSEALPSDQRGGDRVLGSELDIGAFESPPPPIATDDFGDAPLQYPVTLADDGARHVVGTLRLGDLVDAELDGQPSASADRDADDGVVVIADSISDLSVDTVSSFLVTASEPGFLDAWIDFNGDGDWNDSGEQVATSVALSAGDNTIAYTIPAAARAIDTAARFRLSSAGNLSPVGAAVDGEVEDFIVSVLDGATAPNASIILPSDAATIRRVQNRFVVRDAQADLFAVPLGAVGQISLEAGDADDVIVIDAGGGSVIPQGGLRLDGRAGDNTLSLVGNVSPFDLTSVGNVDASNFSRIDLSGAGSTLIVIDAVAVTKLSPINDTVLIVGVSGDAIEFSGAVDWRMTDPLIVDGKFVRTVTHQLSGQMVQVDLPRVWQNVVDPFDVNNDGDVTAGDALRVINELSRRAFSDQNTQDLDDSPNTVDWPGIYFDQNGDDRATALDALRVINRLALISVNPGSGEGAPLESLSGSIDSFDAGNPVDTGSTPAAWAGPVGSMDRLPTEESTPKLPIMKLWIDGDAAPQAVKEIVFRAARRLELETILVANQKLWIPGNAPTVSSVVVRDGANVADRYIVDQSDSGDLAVTADIPLAALLVAKGVDVIDPRGSQYTADNITERLGMRDFMDSLRGAGMTTSGSAPYSDSDKHAFASALDRSLTRLMKK